MSSSVTVVTCFPEDAWETYAKRMLETAIVYLPLNVTEILAYHNSHQPDFHHPRIHFIDNYAILDGVSEFLKRHGDDPKKWGKMAGEKDNFRTNVCAYAHKAYAFYDAALTTNTDFLCWIDSDVEFFAPIPETFFDDVLPKSYFASVLDRGERYHVETGFVVIDKRNPWWMEFFDRYIDFYKEDLFLGEREHHDAWLFTVLMRKMRKEKKVEFFNLSPGHEGAGHPWMASALAAYGDHKKGVLRKKAGKSFQEDLRIPRQENYWKNLPKRSNLKN